MTEMFAAIHSHEDNDRCDECGHSWHGNPCRAGCGCLSAFVDKYAEESA